MRYFEFINDTSNKFWEIHDYWNADIKRIEIVYGKIGSDGRTNIPSVGCKVYMLK